MASDVLKWVLIGGAAYLVYQEFFAVPAAAATTPSSSGTSPTTGGTTTPPSSTGGGTTNPPVPTQPAYQYAPPTIVQQLQAAADPGVTVLNADQWAYYWTNTLKKPAIDPGVFGSLFFPSGRPSDPSQNPTMTAAQFVAAIATKGLSGVGLGAARPLFVPLFLNPATARTAGVSRYRRRVA